MTNRERAEMRREQAQRREYLRGGAFDAFLRTVAPVHAERRMQARAKELAWSSALEASYRFAGESRLRRDSGRKTGGTADQHSLPMDRFKFVEDSRQLDRDNCIYNGLLQRCVDNTVGEDIQPDPQTPDKGYNQALKDWWNDEWSMPDHGSERFVADATGRMSRPEMIRNAIRAVLRDGDMGFFLNNETGQVQAVETERIGTPLKFLGRRDMGDGTHIVNGVRMTAQGRPVSYFVGEPVGYVGIPDFYSPITTPWLKNDAQEIPARDFIHYVRLDRFSQTRGVPALHASIGYFDMLDEYIEAELVGAKVSAMLAIVISGPDAEIPGLAATGSETAAPPFEELKERLRSGTIYRTSQGKVEVVGGNRPNSNFPPFMTVMGRMVGLPIGLPVELVFLDFSTVPYSSARAALLQAYLAFRAMQRHLTDHVLTRLWRWRVGMAITAKELPGRQRSSPLVHDGALDVKWLPGGWKWADVLAQMEANEIGLDKCMTTLAGIAAEEGRHWEDLIDQRAAELAYAAIAAARENGKLEKLAIRERIVLTDIVGLQKPAKASGSSPEAPPPGAPGKPGREK